jgi:hypothetical protein
MGNFHIAASCCTFHLVSISFLQSHMQYCSIKFIESYSHRHTAQHTTRRTQPTNPNTYAHQEDLHINNISNKKIQQFPCPVILTPDDDQHWLKHVVMDF